MKSSESKTTLDSARERRADRTETFKRINKITRKHKCTLVTYDREEYLNLIPKDKKLLRLWVKLIVVSPVDHRTPLYYRSSSSLELERRRHILLPALYIVHPFSIIRIVWEHWMLLVFLFSLLVIPLNLISVLAEEIELQSLSNMSLLCDIACLIDILFTFITGLNVVETKEVSMSLKKISTAYLKSPYFYMDFLSSMSWQVLAQHATDMKSMKQLELLSVIKLFRVRTVFNRLTNTAEMFHLSQNVIHSIKYILILILFIHWLGCLVSIIPAFYLQQKGIFSFLATLTYTRIYMRGLFEAVQYILCISGADEGAINKKEAEDNSENVKTIKFILGIIIASIGKVMMALLIILISQMFANIRSSSTKYYEIINQVNNFMRHRQLPLNVQKRLITYYDYRFQRKFFCESEITSFLSNNIMQQINLFCYRKLVEKVSILRVLPTEAINEVIGKLKCEFFLPNDIIVKNGQIGDCMYFLASGTVCVFTSSGKEICHLESGSYFGEIALVSNENKRTADVIAIETCEIYKLDRRSFKKLLVKNEVVAEKITNLALIRNEQTKLIEEMHKKHIMTRMDREHQLEALRKKDEMSKNSFGRPINWKWNSKVWTNTFLVKRRISDV